MKEKLLAIKAEQTAKIEALEKEILFARAKVEVADELLAMEDAPCAPNEEQEEEAQTVTYETAENYI